MSQPIPTPNDRPPVYLAVCADLEAHGDELHQRIAADIRERARIGRERYGTDLQPHNGRDALRDAYEEALDGMMYAKQAWFEESKFVRRLKLTVLFHRFRTTANDLLTLMDTRE